MDGSLYKRRKLHGTSVALLSEENRTTTKINSYNYNLGSDENGIPGKKDNIGINVCSINPLEKGNQLIIGHGSIHKPGAVISSLVESSSNRGHNNICVTKEKMSVWAAGSYPENFAKQHTENVGNVQCSSATIDMKSEVKDAEESSDAVKESFEEFTSVRELCISVLKSHGLLRGEWNPSSTSSELLCYNDASLSQPCKICGCSDNLLKMLICDFCEEAFHPSCCNPKVKELPVDEWYCQPCFRKKPKPFLQNSTEKSFNIMDRKDGHRRQPYSDLISIMLKDTQPFATDVRIGKDFQVEVPDWSGPNSLYVWSGPNSLAHDYFDKHSEMDPAEFTNLYGWNFKRSNSFGNWIQCREVIKMDENGREIICGKWRRAPLFLLQTEDWDCSCAVSWDPVHADCTVPQELPTGEVMKQLKFVGKVKHFLVLQKRSKSPWNHER